METNVENQLEAKFKFDVPYNHPILVAERKKAKIGSSVLLLIVAAAMAVIGYFALRAENNDDGLVLWIFFGLAGLSAIWGLGLLLTMKPSAKYDERLIKIAFFEDTLEVTQDDSRISGKVKKLKNCLYRQYANKQYVRAVIESKDKIKLRILTGRSNGAPTYTNYSIPKDIFGAGEEDSLKAFLQAKVEDDYQIIKE